MLEIVGTLFLISQMSLVVYTLASKEKIVFEFNYKIFFFYFFVGQQGASKFCSAFHYTGLHWINPWVAFFSALPDERFIYSFNCEVKIIFTESDLRPIQSISHDIRGSCAPSLKPRFPVDWRLLVKECVTNIS